LESFIAFWKAFLQNPRRVGSITPSGAALGEAMVKVVLAEKPGCVVELGAGTGAITRALVNIRSQLDDLIVIEKSPGLAAHLMAAYPALNIVTGCASLVGKIDFPRGRPLTIVSSLPLRSLPRDELNAIKKAIGALSDRDAGFRFIQYSYFGRVPFVSHVSWLTWEKMHTVFANIPPATVWVLSAKSPETLPCRA
jgi:phosphatidylethanolamine/phosphatidyl-N-methylethanolamine N-methyltransferase